jgi:SAM-dependent methyltransferase
VITSLPAVTVRNLLLEIVRRKAESLPPKEAANFLLDLDQALYPLESQAAIRYEGGLHPKHRLTGYHDFFVKRISAGDRVLDVGCRTGEVAYEIADRTGAKVTGIDIDAQSLEEGRERNKHPNLELMEGDVFTWRPNHSFDVVVMSNVLEHLKDRPHLLESLQERSGAKRFLIRVPLFERDWRAGLKRELGTEWRLDDTHETEYTLESFRKEMGEAKLLITHLEVRWGEIWAEAIAK